MQYGLAEALVLKFDCNIQYQDTYTTLCSGIQTIVLFAKELNPDLVGNVFVH